jgi:hypothetical protein
MYDFSFYIYIGDTIKRKEKRQERRYIRDTIAASGSLHIKVRKIFPSGVNEID